MVRGLLFAISFSAATASAQPVDVDVNIDVKASAPDEAPPPPPPPHQLLTLTKQWSFRDGEGYRLDLELARGPVRRRESLTAVWLAGVSASRLDERTPYYGHDDELQAQDTAFTGFFGGALRLWRLETRGSLGAGFERTTGMQTAYQREGAVSRFSPVAELSTQVSIDLGPVEALFGWRVIAHAQRYGTLDGMDTFTREPTLLAFVGIGAALD